MATLSSVYIYIFVAHMFTWHVESCTTNCTRAHWVERGNHKRRLLWIHKFKLYGGIVDYFMVYARETAAAASHDVNASVRLPDFIYSSGPWASYFSAAGCAQPRYWVLCNYIVRRDLLCVQTHRFSILQRIYYRERSKWILKGGTCSTTLYY